MPKTSSCPPFVAFSWAPERAGLRLAKVAIFGRCLPKWSYTSCIALPTGISQSGEALNVNGCSQTAAQRGIHRQLTPRRTTSCPRPKSLRQSWSPYLNGIDSLWSCDCRALTTTRSHSKLAAARAPCEEQFARRSKSCSFAVATVLSRARLDGHLGG